MLQHSPSSGEQAKGRREVLDLGRGEGLRQDVGDHVLGGAVDELNLLVLDDPADEVVADVDVLRTGMVLVVTSERDGGLVVVVKRNTGVRYEIPGKGIGVSTPVSQENWQGAGKGSMIWDEERVPDIFGKPKRRRA